MAGEKFLHGNQALGVVKIGKKKGKGKGEGEGDGDSGAMDERMKGPRYRNGLPRAKKNVVAFKPGVVLKKPQPANPPPVVNQPPRPPRQESPANWAAKAKEGTSAAFRDQYASEDGFSEDAHSPAPVLDFGIAPFPRKGTNARHGSSDSSVSQEMLVPPSPPQQQYQYNTDDYARARPISPPPGFSALPYNPQPPSPYFAYASPGRENEQLDQILVHDPWNKPQPYTQGRAGPISPPPGFAPKTPTASPRDVPAIFQRFDPGLARQLDAMTRARHRAEAGSRDYPYSAQ